MAEAGLETCVAFLQQECFHTLYIDGAVRSSPLGGSLGFVPVFMFWMYMMWLSVLYGLEITMVTQRVGDLRQRERFKAASD